MTARRRIATGIALLAAAALVRGCVVYRQAAESDQAVALRVPSGVRVDQVLSPMHAAGLPSPIHSGFAVTSAGNLILRAGDALIEAERDGGAMVYDSLTRGGPAPSSFALDGSAILTVSTLHFGQIEGDSVTDVVPLPAAGMKLAPSMTEGAVYLFGGTERTNRRVYAFKNDGSLSILAELPAPVVAVADSRKSVYVATETEIFRFSDGRSSVVTRLPPGDSAIVSIAASPDDRMVFYSNGAEVWAVYGLTALAIVTNAGGTLRWANDALWILDTRRPLLAKLSGLEAALTSR